VSQQGLTQLIYASKPFGFDNGVLDDILTVSRFNNARDDITGALICRGDLYLQLIEGPEDAIVAAFARIAADNDRHVDVQPLVSRSVSERMFPGWAMRDDPARSWMWTTDEVSDGAVQAASEAEILGIFERLVREPG
jgi:Sensors of blue-light using FAD